MRRSLFALLVLTLSSAALGAQADSTSKPEKKKGRCTGESPEAALVATAPAYRDCDVDKPARRVGSEPRLQWTPAPGSLREGCFVVELEMIVDTLGSVEPASVRTRRSDNSDLATAVRDASNDLRYQPAIKDGKKVRQVVMYRRANLISMSGPAGRSAGAGTGSCR